MPPIPKQISRQVLPSGRVGDVPIPSDIADTGAGIEAQGLGALGAGVSNLAQAMFKIEEVEGISQASTARGQANARMRQLEAELKFNNDPTTYQAELDKALQDIQGLRPPNPIGSKRFDDFISQSTDGWSTGVNILALGKRKELIEGAYLADWGTAIQNRDQAEADRLTIEARDVTGAISIKTAANALIESPTLVAKGRIQDLLNDANQAALQGNITAASNSLAQAEALANSITGLDADTERLLRSRISSTKTSIENKGVTLQQTAVNLAYENIVKELSKDLDSVTLTNLEGTLQLLPEKDTKTIEGVFNNRSAELGKDNPDPFTLPNSQIYSTILRTLELDAKAMTPTQIFSFVGKGLTPDDFTALNDFRTFALTKDSPLQQPDVKDAFGLVNDIRRLAGTPDTEEDVFEQNDFENKAKQRIIEQVKNGVRGAELDKFTKDMVAPITESAVGNWFGNWWRGHAPHSAVLPSGHHGNWWGVWSEQPGTRFKQPKNEREFEAFTAEITTSFGETEGRAYYDLWKGDFE